MGRLAVARWIAPLPLKISWIQIRSAPCTRNVATGGDGLQSKEARLLMLDAATVLNREEPLTASKLREFLFDRYPD